MADPLDYIGNAVNLTDSDFMSGAIVAILALQNRKITPIGSGIRVHISGVDLIATVGHFDFNEEFKGPFFGNSDWRGIPLSLSRDHYVLDCRFEDDEKGGDLGYIKLRPEHKLGGWSIGMDRFKTIKGSTDRPFILQGYPGVLTDTRHRGRVALSDVEMVSLQVGWLREQNEGHLFDYHETGVGRDGEVAELPHPGGLSGGPIWHVDDMKSWDRDPPGLETIDTKTQIQQSIIQRKAFGVSLFAIQSSWYPSERKNYAVSSLNWLRFVARHESKLAPAIQNFLEVHDGG